MKKLFLILFSLAFILILLSCNSQKVTFEDSYYYPDKTHGDEHIELKNTEFDDKSYKTCISGVLYLKKEEKTAEIDEQNIELIQEYGNIWYANIIVNENKSEKLYFHRLGDNPLPETKKLVLDDISNDYATALTYEHYKNVNYVIFQSVVYLL